MAVLVVVAISLSATIGATSWYVASRSSTAMGCPSASVVGCVTGASPVDLALAAPYQLSETQETVPVYATLPVGEEATSFVYDFGDGSPTITTNASSASHIYSSAGDYILSARADVAGTWHTNLHRLVELPIHPSFASLESTSVPEVSGSVLTNGSLVAGVPATSILAVGESVTFAGAYTSPPRDQNFTDRSPQLLASAGASPVGTEQIDATTASATYAFTSDGVYWVRFVGSSSGPAGTVQFQNFTWSVFVAPSGTNAGVDPTGSQNSTHPGSLVVYEPYTGGTYSIDPAINYDVIGAETMLNIDETLIQYNGSDIGLQPSSFVPVLAACVPGSPACTSLFGSTLVRGTNFTFVLDAGARFYDPATGASWGVYPSDILFSVARQLAFADLPCLNCNPGWILGQALLPRGNGSWDGGIHAPLNNTPTNVLDAVILNGTDCPALALGNPAYHGCVTFRADGQGRAWPAFLEYVAEEQVGEVISCGWTSASPQDAGIPDWTFGNVTGSGDHPCLAPGATGYGSVSPPMTAWDAYEQTGSVAPYWGNVEFALVGSGPYFLNDYKAGSSYDLAANPAYHRPAFCHGVGCDPTPGTYAASVSVTYNPDPTAAVEALSSGSADFVTLPSSDTANLLTLVENGKARAVGFPTLSEAFFAFNLGFDTSALGPLLTGPVSVPSDFLSHVAVRQFLARAYPTDVTNQTVLTVDGITYGLPYGGAIPQFLSDYYPTNVSWPSGTPCGSDTSPLCPGYWWDQGRNASSPYYAAALAACTVGSPCAVPVFVPSSYPDALTLATEWAASVASESGGALTLDVHAIDGSTLGANALSSPYQNALPIYGDGIAPDYPDPTDYVTPEYTPDNGYMFSDAVFEQLSRSAENQTGCPGSSDYRAWATAGAALAISEGCQGAALAAMAVLESIAAVHPDDASRVLLYNWLEQIANGLCLYAYAYQYELVETFAPWIDGASINSNPMLGGSADQLWFDITGNGVG